MCGVKQPASVLPVKGVNYVGRKDVHEGDRGDLEWPSAVSRLLLAALRSIGKRGKITN